MDDVDVRTEIQRAASALGEPKRFDLVCRLFSGERTVGELATESGMTQPLVSHHLAVLRRAGLVVAVSDGRFHRYSLQPGTSPGIHAILDLIDRLVLSSRGRGSVAVNVVPAAIMPSPVEPAEPQPAPPAPGEMEDFLL